MTARKAWAAFIIWTFLSHTVWSQSPVLALDPLSDVEPVPMAEGAPYVEFEWESNDVRDHGIKRDPGHPAKPKRKRPGDINRSDCPPKRYRMAMDRRAGHPQSIAPWARCSMSPKYSGGYIGGGAALCGRPRRQEEGTWGLDYHGHLIPRRVFLNWTCGREQGGEGAYRTDGEPQVVSAAKEHLHRADSAGH